MDFLLGAHEQYRFHGVKDEKVDAQQKGKRNFFFDFALQMK